MVLIRSQNTEYILHLAKKAMPGQWKVSKDFQMAQSRWKGNKHAAEKSKPPRLSVNLKERKQSPLTKKTKPPDCQKIKNLVPYFNKTLPLTTLCKHLSPSRDLLKIILYNVTSSVLNVFLAEAQKSRVSDEFLWHQSEKVLWTKQTCELLITENRISDLPKLWFICMSGEWNIFHSYSLRGNNTKEAFCRASLLVEKLCKIKITSHQVYFTVGTDFKVVSRCTCQKYRHGVVPFEKLTSAPFVVAAGASR